MTLKKINKQEALEILNAGGTVLETKDKNGCYFAGTSAEGIGLCNHKGYYIGGQEHFDKKRVFWVEETLNTGTPFPFSVFAVKEQS